MGRFKNDIHTIPNTLVQYLINGGYKYRAGARGEDGYTKIYNVDRYYVWVTFNFDKKKIYIYKETTFSSMIAADEIDIEDSWLDDEETFIDNVDNELGFWID